MIDALQIVLLILILFWLIGLKRSYDAAMERPAVNDDIRALRNALDTLRKSVDEMRSHLGQMERDHQILDELEESVMDEWAHIIEDKLGKRPVLVPCPSCGSDGGLEPNLLADEDVEYGCPACGAIVALEKLRETYPNLEI